MERILNEIEFQLEKIHAADTLALVKAIRKNSAEEKWRLCIAGAFSRGKTHIINLLLGTDLLPEDIIPSTTVLTQISYGPEIKIEFEGAEERVILKPETESLLKYSADNEYSDAEGILKITYPDDFLKPNIYLYDTPGIDDLLEHRADISFEALKFCDAALVAVSAEHALGIQERQFIEEYVNSRKNPRIALVVSFLDHQDMRAREKILKKIREISSHLHPGIEIWSGEPNLAKDLCEVSGIGEMRKRIRQWAASPDNEKNRKEQVLRDIVGLVKFQIRQEEGQIQFLENEDSEKNEKLRQARRKLREQGEDWLEARDKFLDSSYTNAERVKESARQILSSLNDEKRRNVGVRTLFREITQELADQAQKAFNEDVRELFAEIRDKYGIAPNFGNNIEFETSDIYGDSHPYFTEKNNHIRVILELLDNNINNLVIFLPFSPAGKKVFQEIVRRFLIALRQKFDNASEREHALNKLISEAERDLRLVLRESYGQIADKTLQLRNKWLEESGRDLENKNTGGDNKERIKVCTDNLNELKRLYRELERDEDWE